MNNSFFKQDSPIQFPTPDDKVILEHFGAVATGQNDVSIARMSAPPGWSEPYQTPEFDEYTLMVKGKKSIKIDGETVILKAGESLLVRKGSRVMYANPFKETAEYWSVCIPAFSPEKVNRE